MRTNVILQNEFLENIFVNQTETNEITDFYSFFISELSGYNLICDFEDVADYENAIEENPIWELIIDKINTVTFDVDLYNSMQNDLFYIGLGEHNIFLTNYSLEGCQKLIDKYGFIYLSYDNINIVWSGFLKDKRTCTFKVTKSDIIPDNKRFDTWNKLDCFCPPLRSIVIFDKYILNDNTGQRISENLFPLLDRLLQNTSRSISISLSIICEPRNWTLENRQKAIVRYLKSDLGFKSCNVNVIRHNKSVYYRKKIDGLHGRVILTNYSHIRCDDSFNLFSGLNVNNDADLKLSFSLINEVKCFYEKELSDLGKYIDLLKNNANHPDESLRELFYPNKYNNFWH